MRDQAATVDVLKQIDEQLFLLTSSSENNSKFSTTASNARVNDRNAHSPLKSPGLSAILDAHVTVLSPVSSESTKGPERLFISMEQQVVHDARDVTEELHIREKLAHRACLSGNASGLKFALSFTSQLPNSSEGGSLLPLHEAAAFGSVSIISFLLYGLKVDVNVTTSRGNTALHIACFEGNLDATEFLISAGASVTATNHWGQIAFDLAQGEVLKALDGNGPPCTVRAAAHLVVLKAQSTLGLGPEADADAARHKFRSLSGKVRAHIVKEESGEGSETPREVLEGLCRAYELVKRKDDAEQVLTYAAKPCAPAWAETYQSLELRGAEHAADWMVQNHLDVELLEELSAEDQLSALLDLGMNQDDAEGVSARLRGIHRTGQSGMEEWLRQRGLGKLSHSLEAAGIGSISRLRDSSIEELKKYAPSLFLAPPQTF